MKDNALQVYQIQYTNPYTFNQSPNGTAPINVNATPFVSVGPQPGALMAAINALLSTAQPAQPTTNNVKVFLRQYKTNGMVTNTGNCDVHLRIIRFKVRKLISSNDYGSINTLLQSGTPTLSALGYASLTTSQTAQRHLKFTTTKVKILRAGQTMRYKYGIKYRAPKMITKDQEADSAYLLSPMNRGIIFQMLPGFVSYGSSATGPVTGGAPVPIALQFNEIDYYSMYFNGITQPQSQFTPATPPSSTYQGFNYANNGRLYPAQM